MIEEISVRFRHNLVVQCVDLGCIGTAILAEYQHWVRQGYGYAYHTGTKVPNANQRTKLKFQKYGYVRGMYGYVFWVKQYKNPPKNTHIYY